ncbi:MAG: hypothetical protein WCK67_03725 [bacterium]
MINSNYNSQVAFAGKEKTEKKSAYPEKQSDNIKRVAVNTAVTVGTGAALGAGAAVGINEFAVSKVTNGIKEVTDTFNSKFLNSDVAEKVICEDSHPIVQLGEKISDGLRAVKNIFGLPKNNEFRTGFNDALESAAFVGENRYYLNGNIDEIGQNVLPFINNFRDEMVNHIRSCTKKTILPFAAIGAATALILGTAGSLTIHGVKDIFRTDKKEETSKA